MAQEQLDRLRDRLGHATQATTSKVTHRRSRSVIKDTLGYLKRLWRDARVRYHERRAEEEERLARETDGSLERDAAEHRAARHRRLVAGLRPPVPWHGVATPTPAWTPVPTPVPPYTPPRRDGTGMDGG